MVQLVTPSQLASHLKKDLDTATAVQAIETASAWVETRTGMAFTPRTATIRLPSSSALELPIPVRPLREVTSVSIGGVAYSDFTPVDGMLWRLGGWRTTYGPQPVEVAVGYGFAVTPDDIKGVVLEAAGMIYEASPGVQSETIDDYRVSYFEGSALSEMSRSTMAAYGADVGTTRIGTGG